MNTEEQFKANMRLACFDRALKVVVEKQEAWQYVDAAAEIEAYVMQGKHNPLIEVSLVLSVLDDIPDVVAGVSKIQAQKVCKKIRQELGDYQYLNAVTKPTPEEQHNT